MKRYTPFVIVGIVLTLMVLIVNARLDNDRSFNPPPAPVPVTAHITTTNTPDGRCHEDDPCWTPSSSIGTALVCIKDTNGVITCKETP